ncbi:transient receptor potential cation channel subfamily M member 2 [Dasypus novemcinctus]|uniref:transient receptor potential cation channel subfamily M member 2 n=1 Tax=Dasypus novemcinctus TaxID=9361 RepID=UPI00265DE99E|nr:transient receptor potential cation channel subfamily M member 2 [Dasypus novemcinctus]
MESSARGNPDAKEEGSGDPLPSFCQSNSHQRHKGLSHAFCSGEKESLSSWILKNIKKKGCVHFVASSHLSDAGEVVCKCGYARKEHVEEATKPRGFQDKEWDPKKHVQEMPTDAFGDIVFEDLNQKAAKYVRVSQDTCPSAIYHLMTQYWGLDAPNLLISVTGGAKNFNMKLRLRSVFRRDLVKVAQTTGAWIISGGSHTGVMKQVGEAVRDFNLSSSCRDRGVIAIGIATWGAIHKRESLIRPAKSCEDPLPAKYPLDEEGQGHLTCLDSNHSHFILVDDGTHGRYEVEIPLRTKLEKFISEQTKEKGGVAIKIPIVCVVLEGGPGTLNTIYNAITHGTPCVIMEGSGRVADVIAQVASLPISEITIALIQKKLSMFFRETFETFSESRIVEWTKKIQDIVRQRQLLTVFREGQDGQPDMDVAILQALLKASRIHKRFGHESWDHQLKLAVTWNRVDIARSEIFSGQRQWKPADLHPMMAAALISNKPEFVKLFLENGVQLQDFVTQDVLLYLYNNLEPSCLFDAKLRKALAQQPKRAPEMHLVAQVLRELLGSFTEPLYPPPEQSNSQSPRAGPHVQVHMQEESAQLLGKKDADRYPVRDLLIWAVVQNRREVAEIVWAQSQDCVAAALACSKILKELAKEEGDTDKLEEMLALADAFELRAIGVFTECYRKCEALAQQLLIHVSKAWGQATCLQLALEAKNMKFTSHGGVQAYLTKVWWGRLNVDNSWWRVLLCMAAFPLLFTGVVSFRREPELPPWAAALQRPPQNGAYDGSSHTSGSRREQQRQVGCAARPCAFFSAPVVVFSVNVAAYFAFLLLFAYVLIVDFQPSPSYCELVIYVWLFSLVCEELRQLFYNPGCSLLKAASFYISDFWNRLDVCAILLFIAGLTCRLLPATLYPGRVILSLDFILFCLRLMHIFTVSKTLGPKIIMVKRMMKDVFFFIFLLVVWVVSFGVATQAILIHNESRVDWIFRGVVYHAYLTLFGQLPAYIDGVNFSPDLCSPNGTDPYKPKCPVTAGNQLTPAFPNWLTVILLCLYLLFTNILLLNLLIAMFNYTFQQVQDHTDQIWKFQRHDLIEEYHGRPAAPPPLILLSHLRLLVRRLVLRIPPERHKQFRNPLGKAAEDVLLTWEMNMKENYLQNQQHQLQQRPEQKIQEISDKVNTILDLLDPDQEQKLASLGKQVAQTTEALRWIVKALRDGGFGVAAGIPALASGTALEELGGGWPAEDQGDAHHVNARHLLYPDAPVTRFSVPNEKVPWEVEFLIYQPPFYTAEQDKATADPVGSDLEALSTICFNATDGLVDRRSFHGTYAVQDALPRNPQGRTGLRGRGSLRRFGPNHRLHPVFTRWKRNKDGTIGRRGVHKLLEVLLVRRAGAELWALPGGWRMLEEALPAELKDILAPEFWASCENLLRRGTEVYKGYVDDLQNTDNAWVEVEAIGVHFQDQNDEELKTLNSHLQDSSPKVTVQWQVVDEGLPLYGSHKAILQKVAAAFGAHY